MNIRINSGEWRDKEVDDIISVILHAFLRLTLPFLSLMVGFHSECNYIILITELSYHQIIKILPKLLRARDQIDLVKKLVVFFLFFFFRLSIVEYYS